jgi:hypothetical protein
MSREGYLGSFAGNECIGRGDNVWLLQQGTGGFDKQIAQPWNKPMKGMGQLPGSMGEQR